MVSATKKKLRLQYQEIRDQIPENKRKEWSRKISNRLFTLDLYKSAGNIALYISIGSEVDTDKILKRTLALKKTVLAPRVNIKNHTLSFFSIKSLKDCKSGPYHILQPKKIGAPIDSNKIDLFLVPGILFDKRGYRLGYGKGYYDRLLKNSKKAVTIGLTYEKTLIDQLPHSKQDIPVSYLMTEKRVIIVE